jgi:hypothetical protein
MLLSPVQAIMSRKCRYEGYDSTNYYVPGTNRNRLLVDVGWPGTLPPFLAMLKRKDIARRN